MPPLWVTSQEYDPIMMGPVKAIPESILIYIFSNFYRIFDLGHATYSPK